MGREGARSEEVERDRMEGKGARREGGRAASSPGLVSQSEGREGQHSGFLLLLQLSRQRVQRLCSSPVSIDEVGEQRRKIRKIVGKCAKEIVNSSVVGRNIKLVKKKGENKKKERG